MGELAGFAALGIVLFLFLFIIVAFGIWLAIIGLGALFGTWFVSDGSLERNKNFRPETLAEVFRVKEDEKPKH